MVDDGGDNLLINLFKSLYLGYCISFMSSFIRCFNMDTHQIGLAKFVDSSLPFRRIICIEIPGGTLYLPATPRHNGEIEGLQEALHGGCGEALPDPYQSAHHWCAYAWPSTETLPARRAFFLDASGLSLSTLNAAESPSPYIGAAQAPRWDAAYARADMSGQAGGSETCDGNVWDR